MWYSCEVSSWEVARVIDLQEQQLACGWGVLELQEGMWKELDRPDWVCFCGGAHAFHQGLCAWCAHAFARWPPAVALCFPLISCAEACMHAQYVCAFTPLDLVASSFGGGLVCSCRKGG